MLQCFVNWAAVSITDSAWHQAQLTLQKGWLGLRSTSHHAVLHILHPFVLLHGPCNSGNVHLYIDVYNNQALVSNRITITSLALPHIHITGPSSYPHHWPFLISTSLALPHIHITGPSSYPHHWPFLISTSLALPHNPHHWP